ncbi:hypothetical protein EOI86_16675 [Hwanghaeella grinnelliae]|uniref:Uncharacterized protein n=1 Tax=Hwanghaeella grinnelliae TaxID=2500179 RepID=A0A3S2W5A1_9PROT|nr:hypothetical protein [Hwanghaeella grinnelliae]RVU36798.1 hypothetical protein EOI86_16675 [Hwanghaeella grinnelliae]
MAQELADACTISALVLGLISPLMQLFLMWRAAVLSVIAFVAASLLFGPVRWSDQNFGYFVGNAILVLLCIIVLAALALRLIVATARGRLTSASIKGPETCWRAAIDFGILVATGAVVGLTLAILLANILGGSALGRPLDFGIVLAGCLSAAGFAAIRRFRFSVIGATACMCLSIVALVGKEQPSRILTQAVEIADGQPWCLATNHREKALSSIAQLGFFSLKKGYRSPHLTLMVRDDDMVRIVGNWSIRKQEFYRNGRHGNIGSCFPRTDFADALRTEIIDIQRVAVGPHLYSVPPEFLPIVTPNSLAVRSDMLIGTRDRARFFDDLLEIRYNVRPARIPDDALSLDRVQEVSAMDIDVLKSGQGVVVAGIDPVSGRRVVLNCLRGAWEDRLCQIRVEEDHMAYSFFLPLEQITRWRVAADRVVAFFDDLRVPQ